jgi:4-hydroxyphenylpyruvate dioxygenase-like putative hemolysin
LILPVAARIEVSPESEHEFRVTVTDGAARTVHRVTVPASYYEKLTGRRIGAKELVRLSFEFLLEREPKESILQAFELPVIGRYFPEFEREMRRRLDAS